jgi:hypothetical protein
MMFTNLILFGQQDDGGGGIIGLFISLLIVMAVLGATFVGLAVLFTKAGKPGWAAFIPFYNILVLVEIVGKPFLWFVLALIPCVNIVISILLCIDLAKCFGKSAGYGLGIAFFPYIFVPLLAFGDARYLGPIAKG